MKARFYVDVAVLIQEVRSVIAISLGQVIDVVMSDRQADPGQYQAEELAVHEE